MKRNVLFFSIFLVFLVGVLGIPAFSFALTPKEIYHRVSPGVVFIYAAEGPGKGSGGTGSIISRDGLVLTNAHIFAGDSSRVVSDLWIFLKQIECGPSMVGKGGLSVCDGKHTRSRGKAEAYEGRARYGRACSAGKGNLDS